MAITYKTRNLATIKELAPNTRAAATKWHEFLEKNNLDLLIYDARRTEAEQRANVASGASQTMKSYHLVGQALDFVPIVKGKAQWSQSAYHTAAMKKAIAEAKRLGFTWGADWDNDGKTSDEDFVDSPHLQFEYKGYGTDKVLDKAPAKKPAATKAPAKKTETKSKNPLALLVLPNMTLSTKSTNREAIRVLQKGLNALKFNCGTADGYFGAKTKDAVYRFQSVYCNPADGIFGPKTRTAMTEQLRKLK